MKGLTVWHPWAWAIAADLKPVENRTRATRHRGELAIHSGLHWDEIGATDQRVIDAVSQDRTPGGSYDPPLKVRIDTATGRIVELLPDGRRFVLGAIIAVAELVDVVRDSSSTWAEPGQCHWLLANVRPLGEPVPCRGWQNVWDVPLEVEALVRAQLRQREEGLVNQEATS
ncbi:hypothetical protein AB0J43_02645 [Nonomuraea fuscirosea]